MACGATLKRSLDFDPLHAIVSSASGHTSPIIHHTPPNKRRRLSPRSGSVYTLGEYQMSSGISTLQRSPPSSPFKNSAQTLSSGQILKNIYDEYKKMKHRKQLMMNPQAPMMDSEHNNTHDLASNVPSASSFLLSQPSSSTPQTEKKITETPLLTMKQVGLICERLLKEQEEKLRSEYEKALVAKLSEQYDAFVKFNYDQVQRRISEHPASYVS